MAEAYNPYLVLDYSGYHKKPIEKLFSSLLIRCAEICFTSLNVMQVSNDGTSFEATKR